MKKIFSTFQLNDRASVSDGNSSIHTYQFSKQIRNSEYYSSSSIHVSFDYNQVIHRIQFCFFYLKI